MKIKSYPKINIFLKIVGLRDNYHEIVSRFIIYKGIFDEIEFIKDSSNDFKIVGTEIEDNLIKRAYKELLKSTKSKKIENFFKNYAVKLTKNIPLGAGLGGGSSNAAAFLNLTNEVLKLNLSKDNLAAIGAKVGADVPFFIYGYNSANVSGIGEIIEEFKEESIDLELKLLPMHCDTAKVYKHYRKNYLKFNKEDANRLKKLTSKEILENFKPLNVNDLYQSAIDLCQDLGQYSKDYFLSGSGSSIFRRKI